MTVGVKLLLAGRLLGPPAEVTLGEGRKVSGHDAALCVCFYFSATRGPLSLCGRLSVWPKVFVERGQNRPMPKPPSCCLGILLCLSIFSFWGDAAGSVVLSPGSKKAP